LIGEIRVCVNRDRSDFQLSLQGATVERLDVLQLVGVRQVAGVDQAFGERVKHERVVGVGAVPDANRATHSGEHVRQGLRRAVAIAASMSARWRVYSSSGRAS